MTHDTAHREPDQGHPVQDRGHHHGTADDDQHPAAFWERRYGEQEQIWSGRVNRTMAEVVAGLTAGRALDLGCGEGADAIWLAQQGWTVTGVDISTTAVRRARQAARTAGLDDERLRFLVADLSDPESHPGAVQTPAGTPRQYDLVAASFFHSPVALDRTAVLRRVAGLVPGGGHLLLVTHAAAPPWADPEQIAHHQFLAPAEEVARLDLDPQAWEVVLAETRTREATGPDGEPAVLDDGVVLIRRR